MINHYDGPWLQPRLTNNDRPEWARQRQGSNVTLKQTLPGNSRRPGHWGTGPWVVPAGPWYLLWWPMGTHGSWVGSMGGRVILSETVETEL